MNSYFNQRTKHHKEKLLLFIQKNKIQNIKQILTELTLNSLHKPLTLLPTQFHHLQISSIFLFKSPTPTPLLRNSSHNPNSSTLSFSTLLTILTCHYNNVSMLSHCVLKFLPCQNKFWCTELYYFETLSTPTLPTRNFTVRRIDHSEFYVMIGDQRSVQKRSKEIQVKIALEVSLGMRRACCGLKARMKFDKGTFRIFCLCWVV
ncbi:unnamed protein product [Moneuplotes crassus]|uniref:Uncharacterized protein n=1 Tax=Euplotes crassus TaxID=5936 RepID=A0AAD1UUX6_EUPCR|nr:unnamed protein product [Moneuplotes crassus]